MQHSVSMCSGASSTIPKDYKANSRPQLAVDGSMPKLTLTGSIDVLNAIYQKNFNLTQQLFAQITSQAQTVDTSADHQRPDSNGSRGPNARTHPVKNNVADLEAAGTFRVRGTVANPSSLAARSLRMAANSILVRLSSQTVETSRRNDRYTIERGSIDFNNPLQTEPELDFLATHELKVEDDRYLIRLEVTGTPRP